MSRAEDIFQKLIYFGEDAIDDFIVNLQTEELFLDFKQAVSTGKNGTSLHKDDRKNLAKGISGFGNSEGGVIVWGVECSRDYEIGDVAKAKVKVKNVHRFLSWLENAISGCTIPSHNRVRNHIISVDENGDGFVATYIPKSDLAPLMTTMGNNIYIRYVETNYIEDRPLNADISTFYTGDILYLEDISGTTVSLNFNRQDGVSSMDVNAGYLMQVQGSTSYREDIYVDNNGVGYAVDTVYLNRLQGQDNADSHTYLLYIAQNNIVGYMDKTVTSASFSVTVTGGQDNPLTVKQYASSDHLRSECHWRGGAAGLPGSGYPHYGILRQ